MVVALVPEYAGSGEKPVLEAGIPMRFYVLGMQYVYQLLGA
jgi:hypothetical protein